MPKKPAAETLLALIAGRERAAAMMGDLTEIAQTRGRAWFAAAYLRTLITLGWRIPAAVFCGSTALIGISLFSFSFRGAPADGRFVSRLLNLIGPLLLNVLVSLWFAVPYWLVRYGVRDRVAKLGLALLLCSTAAYVLPWLSLALLVIATAAIVSREWRKPMIALAAIIAAGSALQVAVSKVATAVLVDGHVPVQYGLMALMVSETTVMLAGAIVCSLLHSWMLGRPQASGPAQLAGGTNA